jgi:hypothetical protein
MFCAKHEKREEIIVTSADGVIDETFSSDS